MKKYNNGEFRLKDINQEYQVFGWVNKIRNIGGVVFIDLRDRSGIIQIVCNPNELGKDFSITENIKNEYCLEITGTLKERSDKNSKIATGDVELIAKKITILSKSEALPFNIYEDDDSVTESTSLKYRYLDLRHEKLQQNILIRHKICQSTREYLNSLGFIEIETPILCKSTPEGARDYLVPSRISKGSFYALPQSPQIFKQLLMVAGFEKYYQIAKCFRDEDLRADRQPEFTQIDFEMSFATEEDVWEVTEGLIKKIVRDIKNIELDNFPRLTYQEAMEKYGSDKPDTRFAMELIDLTKILKGTSMNIFNSVIENNGLIKGIIVKNNSDKYSRKDIDILTDFVKNYGAKGLAWCKYVDNSFTGGISKLIEEEKLNQIKETFNITNNDLLLIVADNKKTVLASLGALRCKLGKDLNLIDESLLNFLWITDFPFFEYSETEGRWKAEHNPFTMVKDINTINDPENCISRSYDLVCNGYELASGGVRNYRTEDLKKIFQALSISDAEANARFGFVLEAFKYGVPPHAGIAPGLERLVMVLTNTLDVKDVIAFPKTQSASDLMSEAPTMVSQKQLDELGITIKKEERNV